MMRSVSGQFAALIFALQVGLVFSLLAYVQWSASEQIERDHTEFVTELRDNWIELYAEHGADGLAATIRIRTQAGGWANGVVLMASADGTPIAGNLNVWPQSVPPQSDWHAIDLQTHDVAQPLHIGLTTTRLPGGEWLLTGWKLDDHLRLSQTLQTEVLTSLLVALPIALLGALTMSWLLNRRLALINNTAQAVAGGDMSRRTVRDMSLDSFDRLAGNVNAMLDRSTELVSQMRLVTEGVSHDLRSPLTRVVSRLEQAEAVVKEPEAQAALASMRSEIDTLLNILATALQISRAEAGIGVEQFTTVQIHELLDALAELFEPAAEERGIAISVAVPDELSGFLHRQLMSQALANLIDNIFRHANGATMIALVARHTGGGIVIEITDDGHGMPEARREELRRRFLRTVSARSSDGSGIGLTLVAAIARLHGGRLELDEAMPGLRARILVPDRPRAAMSKS